MKKTDKMKEFENETGKNAIWNGKITKTYKDWIEGKKVYNRDKKRLSLYITEDLQCKWRAYIESNHQIKGYSDLIRLSVEGFLNTQPESKNKNFDIKQISHDLKELLTIIKASSQIILENFGKELSFDVLDLNKRILEYTIKLESKIKESLDNNIKNNDYDILIIDDYYPAIDILTKFFNLNGFKCKIALTGEKGLELLEGNLPKLVLLDILLPDMTGYDVCKAIKSESKKKDIKLYYMTGLPINDIETKIIDTGADGFFLKPFNLKDLNCLFDIMNT